MLREIGRIIGFGQNKKAPELRWSIPVLLDAPRNLKRIFTFPFHNDFQIRGM